MKQKKYLNKKTDNIDPEIFRRILYLSINNKPAKFNFEEINEYEYQYACES